MKFDSSKAIEMSEAGRVKTRDGHKARVLCVDLKGDQPVGAAIDRGDHEVLEEFDADGSYVDSIVEHEKDLMFVDPEPIPFDMASYDPAKHIIRTPDGSEVLTVFRAKAPMYTGCVNAYGIEWGIYFEGNGKTVCGAQLVMVPR